MSAVQWPRNAVVGGGSVYREIHRNRRTGLRRCRAWWDQAGGGSDRKL